MIAASDDVTIGEDDYNAFERVLGDVQAAYSAEDLGKLRKLVTPEMLSYFAEELADNTSRGVVNQVGDVKLLQGDLAKPGAKAIANTRPSRCAMRSPT